jgi:hypothetical protein
VSLYVPNFALTFSNTLIAGSIVQCRTGCSAGRDDRRQISACQSDKR